MARHTRSSYNRWLKRFFVSLLSSLTLIAFFNFFADGVGIFRLNTGLNQESENLLNGRMVAGYTNVFDERELQRLIVDQYAGQRDIVVIGSSRTMLLRKRLIPGNPDFFNHSTAGAGLGDMVSIIGLYKKKGFLPTTVILGMDPWMFNKDNGLGKPWDALGVYYRDMMKEIGVSKAGESLRRRGETNFVENVDRMARYKQLINLDYTVQNWKSLWGGRKMRVTDTVDVDEFVREPDGSVHFPYSLRHAKMIEDGKENAIPDEYFKGFNSLHGTEVLEELTNYLQRHGVRVVFLLPPFHAHAYRSCFENPRYGITLRIEEYLRDLARRKGITVVGSYDPAPYGFRGEDFFDGTHGHEIVMQRLFESYR